MELFYLRAYHEYAYEILFSEIKGRNKIHILINPNHEIKLPSTNAKEPILNPKNVTHIFCIEASIYDEGLVNRTAKLAQNINKPIITNNETSKKFKKLGLATRQMRILGFEEEVVEGLKIDLIFSNEIPKNIKTKFQKNNYNLFNTIRLIEKAINPLNWQPIRKIIGKGSKNVASQTKYLDINNPLAILVNISKKEKVLIPLDRRAIDDIENLAEKISPWMIILPDVNIDMSYNLKSKDLKKVLILTENMETDKLVLAPSTHNLGVFHDTLIGGIGSWLTITN